MDTYPHAVLYQVLNKVTVKIRPVFGATCLLSAIIPFFLTQLELKTFAKERVPLNECLEELSRQRADYNATQRSRTEDNEVLVAVEGEVEHVYSET